MSPRPREPITMTSAPICLASSTISRAAYPKTVILTSPCAFTPAWVNTSTQAATAAFASPEVSSGGTMPAFPPYSRSRKWSTQTSPLDNTARSRAASTARSEGSEWSTATRILSYMGLSFSAGQ